MADCLLKDLALIPDKSKVAELSALNMCGNDAASKRHKICHMRAIFAKLCSCSTLIFLKNESSITNTGSCISRIMHNTFFYLVHRSFPLYIQV